MFDDYVEHAADPPPITNIGNAIPNIEYEGFEPDQYAEEEQRLDRLGQAFYPGAPPPDSPPMFELGRVQYTLPAALSCMSVSSDILTMALKTNTLLQLNLKKPDAIITITLPTKKTPQELILSRVFLDPTGKHLVITTEQGDNFYSYDGWTKARQLSKFRMPIESIAWNPFAIGSTLPKTSTREILLGGRNGTIYEAVLDAQDDLFKSQDRYLQPVFTLPEKQPITGITFEGFSQDNRTRRGAVIVTTATRIYQFSGPLERKNEDGGRLFESLFEPYRTSAPKFVEIPGPLQYSELHSFTPPPSLTSSSTSTSQQLAWLTGSGIYHGMLTLPPSSDTLIDSASLLPYPLPPHGSGSEPPISICLTEFHFVILYRDRICAVSSLDETLVWEEALPLKPNEKPVALTADKARKTYWLYTDSSLFELVIKDEDRDVWNIYLRKESYDLALRYTKTPPQRAMVNSALAEHQFNQGNYLTAAQNYAQSATPFEEVALSFSDLGEKGRDGMRLFLIARLERCAKTDLTQRMLLATWLVEFYLSKINQLDDLIASESASSDVENMKVEQAILEDDLRGFFETYKPNLDRKTTYGLILSHGRNDMYLHYAGVMGDFDKVLEYHVMEEEWIKAVDVLNRQTDLELYYRFSPTLMRNAPKETVDAWLRQSLLDPRRLIPAILQHQHRSPAQSPLAINHAIRYLQHVVFKAQSTSPTIHNLLLTLYLTSSTTISSPLSATKEIPPTIPPPPTTSHLSPEDLPLLRFLSTAPVNPLTSKPYYDLDYALRLCKQNNKLQACVHIYAQMAMWEECVELALEMGELELAKINCERAMETSTIDGAPAVDESLRKRLWLKVAKFVVQDKKDIKTAMQLLDNTPVLKIEDILPFFPDFVVIDDFKDEICTALEQYSAHIETLKAEMDEATRSAESIKKDIKELKNRFVTVEQSEKCSICSLPLLTRHFYVFPCQHTFHADCLIGQVKEYLTSTSLRKLITLQNELVRRQIANGAPPNAAAPSSASATPDRVGSPAPRQPTKQRTLLSATFNPLDPAGIIINPAVRLATSLNPITMPRNVLALAGDRLRDLVVPDALANAIGGMGAALWGSGPGATKGDEAEKLEKLREELDDLLAASCPLCEGVVAGLDKPFIGAGEVDRSWDL